MGRIRAFVSFAMAGAMVFAVALAGGVGEAHAAKEIKPPKDEREIKPKKGPYVELAINSMDLFRGVEFRIVSCLDYQCPGTLAGWLAMGDTPKQVDYQLVRWIQRGPLFVSDCDEVLDLLRRLAQPADLDFQATLVQTRWMRLGSDVGWFQGRLSIDENPGVDGINPLVRIFNAELVGTTGFRLAFVLDLSAGDDRCNAPLHDEGFYTGKFERKGLRMLLAQFTAIPAGFDLKGFLKDFPKCRVAGTLEGNLIGVFDAPIDYCDIQGGGWCFDGLMRCPCKPPVTPEPREGMTQIDPPSLDAK